ncbi:hypothetical protein [Actinoplanes sp. NPDC049265]
MTVISTWRAEDPAPSRLSVARELVAVWTVHVHRSLRLILS